jgi:gluconate 2-dehydrogenase gamma chain
MTTETAFSRRELLRRFGITGAAVIALPELSRVLLFQRDVLARQTPKGSAEIRTLTAVQFATLAAVCARLIPSDETGPGATEARAVYYIDRALGGWLSSSRDAYTTGLMAIDDTARKRSGRSFIDLSAADQDAVLGAIEESPFFALLRTHTLQGTFCDPAYGGNANFVGWDLIGYPGVRLAVTADDQRMSSPPKPVRRSAYDYAMFSAIGATHAH